MSSPIAVVGLACRLPDDVSCPEELWQVILEQRDTLSEPGDRWNTDGFHHPGRSKSRTTASRKSHFLKRDVMAFDAPFFNVNAAEALSMAPEQRIVLEVTYEALENAGLTLEAVAGSKTGCYVGTCGTDYRDSIVRDTETAPRYTAIGFTNEMPANRVSWFYNMKGPSMTLSTACSSSLSAIHVACQGLLTGETDMAVAGGVNLMLNPDMLIFLNRMGFSSPEGRSKSFDASGDGYGRGEGCGIVVLKRLDDAIRDKDPIRAIIRGTGINSDGYTQGFTTPSTESQAALIREVYSRAGLDVADTQFFECHGTGTKVGDPLETKAVYETIAAKKSQPLVIGSVKPNIGHLESASGVAALIKSILALEKGLIPPQVFFKTPNPAIPFEEWNLKVPTTLMPWPATRGPRRVSINNFGVGGTNAHVIVDSAPPRRGGGGQESTGRKKQRLFVVSSRDNSGVVRVARSLAAYLDKHSAKASPVADLAYTLGSKRSRLPWKTFCIASGPTDLRANLLALTADTAVRASGAGRIGFVFTGQGAQWATMGLKLMEFPVFKRSFEQCQSYLKDLDCPWDAAEELSKPVETSRIKSPWLSQPMCTIIQIGLVDLLASWNVTPAKVVGHSSGEIAAAYCAGFLSAREAVEVAYLRGKLCAGLIEDEGKNGSTGGMLAVACSREKAEELISEVDAGYLTVACVNSHSNVTISGDVAAIEQLHDKLKTMSVFVARLKVDVAYHSNHMQKIFPDYVQSLAQLHPSGSDRNITMVSSVEAAEVDAEAVNGFYWGRNLVSPVLFSDALAELVRPGQGPSTVDVLVEIGPHGALKSSVGEILATINAKAVEHMSSLSRGKDDQLMVLTLAGNLFTRGIDIDMDQVNGAGTLLTDLPPYPWQHSKRFDASSRIAREYNMRDYPPSSLLGAPMPSVGPGEHIWRGYLDLAEEGWVRHHVIGGAILYPGAGLVAMALEGARRLADPGRTIRSVKLRDVAFGLATIVNDERATELVLHTRPHILGTLGSSPAAWLEFSISSSGGPDMPLRENCHGLMRIEYEGVGDGEEEAAVSSALVDYQAAAAACTDELTVEDFYRDAAATGLGFGPTFQNMQKIWYRPGEAVYQIRIADPGETYSSAQPGRTHFIHPTTMDSIVQTTFAAMYAGPGKPVTELFIPTFVKELEFSADLPFDVGTTLQGFTTAKAHGIGEIDATMDIFDDQSSRRYVKIRGYRATAEARSDASGEVVSDIKPGLAYSTRWENSLELVSREDLVKVATGQTPDERLAKIVAMILHQSPNTTTLEVLDGQSRAIHPTIVADPRPQQIRYAVLEGSPAPDVDGEILELKPGKAAETQFDLVIIGQGSSQSLNDRVMFDHILGHVKPGGRIIFGFDYEQLSRAALPGAQVDVLGHGSDAATILTMPLLTNGHAAPAMTNGHTTPPLTNGHAPVAVNGDTTSFQDKVLLVQPASPNGAVQSFSGQLAQVLQDQGFETDTVTWSPEVASAAPVKHVISLLELDTPFMDSLSQSDFDLFKGLVLKAESLLWLTALSGPSAYVIDGALRVARRELGNQQLKVLHMSSLDNGAALAAKALLSDETEFLQDDQGFLKIGRVVEDHNLNAQVSSYEGTGTHMESIAACGLPLKLSISKPGLLDTLYFGPREEPAELKENEVEIQIKASGMNFRDVMISMGLINYPHLGFEGAGVVSRTGSKVTNVQVGDRVSAHVFGSHSNIVRTIDIWCAKIPDSMSYQEGASLPVVFTTAYHALVNIAKLRPKQSVLIHAAAGGVGQAAIQIARHLDLQVYVTVGSEDKKELIVNRYGIPKEHIFDSRSASFVMGIKRVTGGRGVDCVLNSLSGELLRQSWYCLAPLGTFVEIGNRDINDNTRLDMAPFSAGTTFTSFPPLEVLSGNPEIMADNWRKVFDHIREGTFHAPTPLTVIPVHKVKDAFRLMQHGKHRGKIVLSFENSNDEVPVLRNPRTALSLDPSGTYLLVGGLGGLGRSLAEMLVDSGARNIAFISRSGMTQPAAKAIVEQLSVRPNVNVKVYAGDVSNQASLATALKSCSDELPPIKGVFQMAMVLRDAVFENMTADQWTATVKPKIDGTRNLHEYFGSDKPLDFFVMFSSLSGVIGNRGQANYAAGNTYQDALAHHRRSLGLNACAVDLGIMLDVGVLAETGTAGDLVKWERLMGIKEPTFHALIKTVVNGGRSPDFPAQITVGLATAGVFQAAGIPFPDWLAEARFGHLATTSSDAATADAGAEGNKSTSASLPAQLAAAKTTEEALTAMIDGLVDRLSAVVSIPTSEVDTSRPMYMYGVDSLVAMEFRNWLQREIKADIVLFEVLEAVPITKFAEKVVSRTKLLKI
ncbi:hypothetical protein MCOR25_008327 [Pyricularia grisea]|nr:hypothetical protein MCOR25_008327 [Pyricularia grisea]